MIALDLRINTLSLYQVFMLFLAGLCSLLQQLGQSIAFQHEKAAKTAAINYIVVVNAFAMDVFFFGVNVKWSDLIGASFIICFTLLNALLNCFGKSN